MPGVAVAREEIVSKAIPLVHGHVSPNLFQVSLAHQIQLDGALGNGRLLSHTGFARHAELSKVIAGSVELAGDLLLPS